MPEARSSHVSDQALTGGAEATTWPGASFLRAARSLSQAASSSFDVTVTRRRVPFGPARLDHPDPQLLDLAKVERPLTVRETVAALRCGPDVLLGSA